MLIQVEVSPSPVGGRVLLSTPRIVAKWAGRPAVGTWRATIGQLLSESSCPCPAVGHGLSLPLAWSLSQWNKKVINMTNFRLLLVSVGELLCPLLQLSQGHVKVKCETGGEFCTNATLDNKCHYCRLLRWPRNLGGTSLSRPINCPRTVTNRLFGVDYVSIKNHFHANGTAKLTKFIKFSFPIM